MNGAVRQPIAARNVIFGVANFFVLPVPPPWELVRGPFQPEVDNRIRRGDVPWVIEGRGAYLLFDRGTKRGIELHIEVKKGGVRHREARWRRRSAIQGTIFVGGHPAEYAIGTLRRGLWPRATLHRLRVSFLCAPLSRAITLELVGAYGQQPLLELLPALEGLECH